MNRSEVNSVVICVACILMCIWSLMLMNYNLVIGVALVCLYCIVVIGLVLLMLCNW